MPILPAVRDPRLITVRRGGTLSDEHHRLLAEWAALCAEHVLHLFDEEQPCDTRPRDAIDVGRAWVRGEVRLGDARRAAFAANAAARGLARSSPLSQPGPFVASHSDRDRSQRRARKPIDSLGHGSHCRASRRRPVQVVETGQLELADSNVTPDFVNHRAVTETAASGCVRRCHAGGAGNDTTTAGSSEPPT
jgi:hypothetical protein